MGDDDDGGVEEEEKRKRKRVRLLSKVEDRLDVPLVVGIDGLDQSVTRRSVARVNDLQQGEEEGRRESG